MNEKNNNNNNLRNQHERYENSTGKRYLIMRDSTTSGEKIINMLT